MMKTYAIFYDDLEIHIDLKEGGIDSIPFIRDEVIEALKKEPNRAFGMGGYVEQYPFYQADWEVTGSNLPSNFDYSQILEL